MPPQTLEKAAGKAALDRPLVLVMAAAAGIAVANLYYIQPLLGDMARSLHATQVDVGFAATLTQAGYAIGMLLILPLADIREKKRLILLMLCLSACSLLFMSFSWNSSVLLLAAFAVGCTSVVPQLIVPLAAQMAEPGERGKIIGTVMSGLLIGILLSRTFSGFVGGYFGWQTVYWIAAGLMVALALLLSRRLPVSPPNSSISYGGLFKSMASLVREKPVVREAALNGAMMFAAFSAFWTTLVFLLEGPQYNMGATGTEVAGLFGLVGVVGAAAAPVAGRIADRRSPRLTIWIGMAVVVLAYLCFLAFGFSLWGLIAGVILLDLGVQSCQISNQARIHALGDETRNRLNTIYMVTYFVGGAAGSLLASCGYSAFGWYGVCAIGLLTQAVALAVHVRGMRRTPEQAIRAHQ